jgi:hypothetical protein
MAKNEAMKLVSFEAGADLSAKQFYFVSINASGQVVVTGDGAYAAGVNHGDVDAAGKATPVAISGITKVVAGAATTRGGPVASDSAGRAVNAASGDVILGEFLEAAGAAANVVSILFHPRGAQS